MSAAGIDRMGIAAATEVAMQDNAKIDTVGAREVKRYTTSYRANVGVCEDAVGNLKCRITLGRGWQNNLDVEILCSKAFFTIVLHDGEEWRGKLLAIGRYHLHVETEEGEILLPKHAVKYYVVEESSPKEAVARSKQPQKSEKEAPLSLKLDEIQILSLYERTSPSPEKIDHALSYYREHGVFDKKGMVKRHVNGWMLHDGYTRYLAAERMGMEAIPIRVLGPEGEERVKGVVKNVLHDKGYGFITLEGTAPFTVRPVPIRMKSAMR